jgi:predicted enzyme related to lactoylglutathione lyase
MSDKCGNFFWYELITTDAAGAESFYKAVVGWGAKDSGMPGDMKYNLFTVGDVGIAGFMQITPEMCESANPCWMGVIMVDDTDAYVEKIKAKGGHLFRPADDIPGVGRFAVMGDPHGAVFEIMSPEGKAPSNWPDSCAPGMPGWHELHAGDGVEAWNFYSDVFGWTKGEAMDMGAHGVYQTFNVGDETIGAMMTKMPDTLAPFWLYYFNVEEINSAIDRVNANGGKVCMGPHEVPGGGQIVQCLDPQGAMFALLAPGKS